MLSDFKNLDFKFIEAFKQIWTEPRYSYILKPRKNYGLLYVTKGKIIYKTEDQQLELKAGDIIFLHKNANYEVEFISEEGGVEDYLINFDIDSADYNLRVGTAEIILHDTSMNLKSSFSELAAANEEKDNLFLIKSLFFKCLNNITLLEHSQNASKEILTLEYAKNLITDFDNLSVEEIASKLSFSHSTFQKKFKSAFGLSPVEYRVVKKIEKAKLLLSTTDIPIKEIALKLNYYDEAYFYKQFKKYCNTTPKQYREINLNSL